MKYLPSKKQLRFLDWEVGMFFHFGIRSFNPGHRDWDGIEMPPETFNPTELNCDEWMKAAKTIGAKYAIMTCKHHDGFALWPSKYTPYSVAASPWKDGKGDMVKEFTDACRRNGMKVGLYYSPAQWGSWAVEFKDGKEYDDYFINQISELLTNYGKIDYLWFDGCGSAGHEYDQKRIIPILRSLQKDMLIFGMWDPDTRWVGNEDGYTCDPNPYVWTVNVLGEQKTMFIPAECDCKLRRTWFYDRNASTIKSVNELMGMYEYSVGRGSNLLLNVGPDDRGRIPEADMKRLTEFRAEIDRRYGCPVNFDPVAQENDNTFSVTLNAHNCTEIELDNYMEECTAAIISEDVTKGQKVTSFKLFAHAPSLPPARDFLVCVAQGGTIGHKRICRFPAIRACKFTLEVTTEKGAKAVIRDIKIY